MAAVVRACWRERWAASARSCPQRLARSSSPARSGPATPSTVKPAGEVIDPVAVPRQPAGDQPRSSAVHAGVHAGVEGGSDGDTVAGRQGVQPRAQARRPTA